MKTTERIARNHAIITLRNREVPVRIIAEAYGLTQQAIYNVINTDKAKKEVEKAILEAKVESTKKWIDKVVRDNKRTHVRAVDVTRGIIAQINKLYEGETVIELIDYLETVISNVYTFEYCNSKAIANYCTAKRDGIVRKK